MKEKKQTAYILLLIAAITVVILIIGLRFTWQGADGSQYAYVGAGAGQGAHWRTVLHKADGETASAIRQGQIHSWLYAADAEALKAATAEFDMATDWVDLADRFVILDRVQDTDIVLYGLSGFDGMALRDGGHVYPLEVPWAAPRIVTPEVYAADYDGDGEREYAVTTVVFTGTGVHVGQLYIVEPSAGLGEIASCGDMWPAQELNARITTEYDAEWDLLEVSVDGAYRATLGVKRLEEFYGSACRGLAWGDQMTFTERNGQLWLCAETGILLEDMVTPVDGYWFRVTAPVLYDASGAFSLGDIHLEIEEEELLAVEEAAQPKEREVNVLLADVTHDGIEERIVTSMEYFDGQEEADIGTLLRGGGLGHVRVYEGETVRDSGQQGYCIWEQEFAVSRPGNVQISVAERDGLAYLLTSCLGFQQGSLSYQYDVFSLDASGRVFMEDARQLNYDVGLDGEADLENDAVLRDAVGTFRAHIAGWLGNAALIAATDINTAQEAFVSEGGSPLSPHDYYDVILGIAE
ncbi:MAG: hypothetical protein NC337_02200 [Roseburia sp.]|nr:hypothetical protein [Roseburia sp.]